jgi:hypothetical protein
MVGGSINPKTSPLKLDLATVPANRAPLPVTWARYIQGDYPGLYNLAGQLLQFVSACNSHITEMTRHINSIIAGDHEWSSDASTGQFKASYGQDVIMMNGFNRTVVAMAGVIETLAQRLAGLEHNLEQQLEAAYQKGAIVHDGLGSGGPNFKANPKMVNSPNKAVANAANAVMRQLQENREAALVQADEYRNTAAGALSVLNSFVSSGFTYYLHKTGFKDTLDPGGLLSPEQLSNDNIAISRLEKQLADQQKALGSSGLDLNKVVAELQKGGADAQKVGDVLAKFKGVKGIATLGTILQKGGKFATEIAPILLEIGRLAA